MSDQQSAIEFVPVTPVVHRDDPHTSALSARAITKSGERKRQAELVLAKLRWWSKAYHGPMTSAELADASGIDRYVVARRLPELADPANGGPFVERGPARACRVTGRQAITWRVVPAPPAPEGGRK